MIGSWTLQSKHYATPWTVAATFVLAFAAAPSAALAETAFERGWTLDAQASALNVQSVKNETKVESSRFATFSGVIDETGTATVTVELNSIDTGIDLRNVRMRFLFFQTFEYPQAVITMEVDEVGLADLPLKRRKTMRLPYTLTLHGVTKEAEADVAVTLLTDHRVSVASTTPISVAAEEFDLMNGVAELEEAAGVDIIPSGTVSFDFVFQRNGSEAGGVTVAGASSTEAPNTEGPNTEGPNTEATASPFAPAVTPASVTPAGPQGAGTALESQTFSREECVGRFEILSRTNSITFRSGSARLDRASTPFLDTIVDIVKRCPGLAITVAGHTDADGSNAANQRLSQRRAAAVERYLADNGVEAERIEAVGYGEERPLVANDTPQNKAKNRRIEFAAAE